MRPIQLLVVFIFFVEALAKPRVTEISNRKLKSYNGRYLSTRCFECDLGDEGAPTTLGWISGQTEHWTFKYINDHEVALLGSNGYYLQHDRGDRAGYGTQADEWEFLTPVENSDGSWSFKSRYGKWLSAHDFPNVDFMPENKGSVEVDADVKAVLFSPKNGGKRMLKSWNGRYLSEGGEYCSRCTNKWKPGAYPITIHENKIPGTEEQWTFEFFPESGEVALKGNDGRFLQHGPRDNARIAAQGAKADEWEFLTPVKNADGSWSFRSRWNKWLSAHDASNVEFMPENKDCEQWWIE